MVSIYKRQKNLKTTQRELEDVITHLKTCGVHVDYAVHEKHGRYNRLHTHAIVRFTGRYKTITSYGNREYEGFDFKIHWKPIHDVCGCMGYLEKTFNHVIVDLVRLFI